MKECLRCKNITSEYYSNNKNICKECVKEKSKEWRLNNKDKVSLYNKKNRENNPDYHENWKLKNEGYMEEYQSKWRVKNKKYYCEYRKLRSLDDSLFKERMKIGGLTRKALLTKKWKNESAYYNLLKCTKDVLIKYFEDKFVDGMNWGNYGDWEIDHIVPLSNANTIEELYELGVFTNLQPLWSNENRRKKRRVKKTQSWEIKKYNIETLKI